MRVLIWGLGYVGTVSAACFAELGHEVIGVETNRSKVEAINGGGSAIKEPGLAELVQHGVESGRLRAVDDGVELVSWADVSLICVGTPSGADGKAVLDYIRNVSADIGRGLKGGTGYHVIAVRSTVFPGTIQSVIMPTVERYAERCCGRDFGLVMNPEFLREATAINDFHYPPYTVIGEYDTRSGDTIQALYTGISAPFHRVSLEEAEVLKLINNSFHALKIGFGNEVGRLCDRLDIDSHVIMDMVCADSKLNISRAYLRPGFAFGGSCLPKDLRSLTVGARQVGAQLPILESILPSNELQVDAARRKIHETGASRVGILGLSFKPHTDDLRESPVISLIRQLWQDGIDVVVHDCDVRLDSMLGSNRAYLERQLPQIAQILRPDLDEVLCNVQVVVVSQNRPEYAAAIQRLIDRVTILDLVRMYPSSPIEDSASYKGMSW